MTERPHLICWACQRPVDPQNAAEGIDGETYHPKHRPTYGRDRGLYGDN